MGAHAPGKPPVVSALVEASQRALLLGLAWVSDHLAEFAIDGDSAGTQPFSRTDVARIKPVSELALTVWVLKRCGIEVPVLDHLADWAWRETGSGRQLVHLLLARNDFLPCCALYAPLYRLGYRSDALHAVLEMLARSDMATVLPLQPWSRLALAYNLWHLGLGSRPQARGRGLYVAARAEPWVVSGEVAYAITHEVFYLTDFGFRPLGNSQVRTYLRTWVPYWAEVFVREGDDDVGGELAMVLGCIGAGLSLRRGHPLLSVLAHQRSDGSVRGPEGAGGYLRSDGDPPARREFLACYHTTLVALMAAALTLRLVARRKPRPGHGRRPAG